MRSISCVVTTVLPTATLLPPLRPVLQQVVHRDAQVVIGGHEAGVRRDAVAVMVGVAGEGDVEAVLEGEQRLHRIRRGRVHADPPVPVARHEPERRIDRIVGDGEVEPVVLGDARPVMHAGAAQRVDAHAHAGAADDLQIQHRTQVRDVVAEEVMAVRGRCGQRLPQAERA